MRRFGFPGATLAQRWRYLLENISFPNPAGQRNRPLKIQQLDGGLREGFPNPLADFLRGAKKPVLDLPEGRKSNLGCASEGR